MKQNKRHDIGVIRGGNHDNDHRIPGSSGEGYYSHDEEERAQNQVHIFLGNILRGKEITKYQIKHPVLHF